jgi:hypothetical protein
MKYFWRFGYLTCMAAATYDLIRFWFYGEYPSTAAISIMGVTFILTSFLFFMETFTYSTKK